jgi:hypothetical protein
VVSCIDLQDALCLAKSLPLEPLPNSLIHLHRLLRERPVGGCDFASCQVRDERIHALRHLRFEYGVVTRLDEEYRLFDDLLVKESLIFFPVCTALAIPIHWVQS